MNADEFFNAGTISGDIVPKGEAKHQAIHSLRGYAYQILAAALAWVDIDEKGQIFLEVAEDYAVLVNQALSAVQVKDTAGSGSVTLNRKNIRDTVANFVGLVAQNPDLQVNLHFFTTSEIGTEKTITGLKGVAGLKYWKKVAAGKAKITPLRNILESDKFSESVRAFSKNRNDENLRRDLIERIHWDCGKPDFSILHQELEARLIVVGRDKFDIPSKESRRLSDCLVHHVLKKSIANTPRDRVLTRADLYELIDNATRVSVKRNDLEALNRFFINSTKRLVENQTPSNSISTIETNLFIDGSTLPSPQKMITRGDVESAVTDALKNFGVSILIGGSGLGKTTVSRAVAKAQFDKSFIMNLRNTKANKTHHRLDQIFARLGGLPSSILILEDLNHLDDTNVVLSLMGVIEALRRRNRQVLITCYRKPSLKALNHLNLNKNCVVDCRYFSKKEVHELVRNYRGDHDKWGNLAHVVGNGGHPQLTHAFVVGIAERGWPAKEIENIISRGFSSDDTDAARDTARRSLVSELPEGRRNLLYRLSLIIGYFNRSLALTIGEIPPQVNQTGECMDQLLESWIDAVGRDIFTVSPLASSFGRKMLSSSKQKQIHETIAVQMLKDGKVNVIDLDSIMIHAMAGKSIQSLITIVHSVLQADPIKLEMLAEHCLIFRCRRTDKPIYPENSLVSAMLRLAQFRLETTMGDRKKISDILAAFFNEISNIPENKEKYNVESITIPLVLKTRGIANYFDDWVDLLLRFKNMVETNDDLSQNFMTNTEDTTDVVKSNFFSLLFNTGSADPTSVSRLEHIINKLDKLNESERALLLEPRNEDYSDYFEFINSPWSTEQRRETFNAADATISYQRMAEKTRNWSIRPISLQCSVAQAVMLNEYQNDKEGALVVLEEAVKTQGEDPILSCALAKVYFRNDEHESALKIFRSIVNQIGSNSPVSRAFTLREAAISAAKCNEWSQAEEWFLDAQKAAKLAQADNMRIMAIGLGADSGVAAFETGEIKRALTCMAEAMEALDGIEPKTILQTYCHHVIPHTVLWMKPRIERNNFIHEKPIIMEAGTCSNPNPSPEIGKLPLGHIDCVWYMLAETEVTANLDVGITATLEHRLTKGPIPVLEAGLRTRTMEMDINKLDAIRFAAHLKRYVEATIYHSMLKKTDRSHAILNTSKPKRGQIPTLDKKVPFDPVAEQLAQDTILAYGIRSVLAKQPDAMTKLESALTDQFTKFLPGKLIFDYWNEESESLTQQEKIILDRIKKFFQNEHITPGNFWMTGLRFFEWVNKSIFKSLLIPYLAAWQRSGWERIVDEELFRLSEPQQTVPPIKGILMIPKNDSSFIAKLILATSEAVNCSLESQYQNTLKVMAKEESP